MDSQVFDALGVGAGPFNLSVAALLHPIKTVRNCFLEKQTEFSWHAGMLLPDTTVQNSFLKDLVSFADPTSAFSFLAFLHEHKRLYQYVNAGFQRTGRREFNQYLQWAARCLPAVQWGEDVKIVKSHSLGFEVFTETHTYIARNLIVGTGPRPSVPVMARPFLGEQVFHSSDYLFNRQSLSGRRIAVIGGGQSGAEIVLDLLGQSETPSEIFWLSSRPNLAPLDESHFANELFTPAYVEYFWRLDKSKKHQLLEQHTLTSDGISPETLEALYQRLYQLRFVDHGAPCRLMHSRRVENIRPADGAYLLDVRELDTERTEVLGVERIVLATGYRQDAVPAVLENLLDDIEFSGDEPVVHLDFSLGYRGAGKIFLLNAARHSHGVSEPNLSLNSWRAATIVNAIVGYEHYASPHTHSMLELGHFTNRVGVS
jgi:lysine N6-hydroxylase